MDVTVSTIKDIINIAGAAVGIAAFFIAYVEWRLRFHNSSEDAHHVSRERNQTDTAAGLSAHDQSISAHGDMPARLTKVEGEVHGLKSSISAVRIEMAAGFEKVSKGFERLYDKLDEVARGK